MDSGDSSVVIFDDYFMNSDSIKYKKNSSTVITDDKTLLTKDSDYILSKSLQCNTKLNICDINNSIYFDKKKELWLYSDKSKLSNNEFKSQDGLLSGCNIENPDWTIHFTEANYYKDKKFAVIYNPTLYIKDKIPIFYLPIFGFPTDMSRHSGLLTPKFGFVKNSGVVYEQPIYFAPQDNYDIEINPQIRTERGSGIYSTFRFVDSKNSKGYLKSRLFQDREDFTQKLLSIDESIEYKHSTHYGFDAGYNRANIISNDKLFADIHYLSDIGYTNLSKIDSKIENDNFVKSRLNYYMLEDNIYLGLYGKYFIDTSVDDNSKTEQILPELQLHIFPNNSIIKNLSYYIDMRFLNIDSNISKQQFIGYLPITYNQKLFNDYIDIILNQELYITNNNHNSITTAEISSSLIKDYDILTHFIKAYSKYSINRDNDDKFVFGALQYLYLSENNYLKHSIEIDTKNTQEIYNEVVFNYLNKIKLSNEILYSIEQNKLKQSTLALEYDQNNINAKLSNIYKDIDRKSNYYTISFSYKPSSNYRYFADYEYDKILNQSLSKGIGIEMKKRCLSYNLRYKEEHLLGSTTMNRVIYLQLHLTPIMKLEQKYSFK
jgi:LPS-assembly protein